MPFGVRSFTKKLIIVLECRPTSLIPKLKSKTNNFTLHFKQQNHDSFMYCVDVKTDKLVLLSMSSFVTERSTIWTKSGFIDLSNLYNVGK